MHPLIHTLDSKVGYLKSRNVGPEVIKVFLKEELQNYILYAIYNNSDSKNLVFVGGTCLRKVYGLNRLSEDLDFENYLKLQPEQLRDNLLNYLNSLELDFTVDATIQAHDLISRITVKFPILHTLGLSPYPSEKLHVKVELSTPDSKQLPIQRSMIAHEQLAFVVTNYDLPIMMAGKILACLTRKYVKGNTAVKIKGRDFYDLIWYMQQGILPELAKIHSVFPAISQAELFTKLDEKVAEITTNDLYVDLRFFFESQQFIKDWCENFQVFYQRYRKQYYS